MTEGNPFTSKANYRGDELVFKCPTCSADVHVKRQMIDLIIGVNVACVRCKNISHVPGGYKAKSDPRDLHITAGVQVAMPRFADWYFEHPEITAIVKSGQADLLNNYGLWGFCSRCYHQFPATVLTTFALARGVASFTFFAHTPDSARDWDALRAGHCSACANTNLIVVVAEVPDYVRTVIESKR